MEGERLTVAEAKQRYPNEWVLLVELDGPDGPLQTGVVAAHDHDRQVVSAAAKAFREAAVFWTGRIMTLTAWILGLDRAV